MAPLIKIATLLGLSLLAAGQGTQFITGACTSDADCAAGCCGFNSGKCAGAVVAQTRDGGCGFGDAQPNSNAAQALGFSIQPSAAAATPAPATHAPATQAPASVPPAPAATSQAKAPGTQFITGACTSDADCASVCCGFKSGKCAAPIPAQERDGGCGFGDSQPNNPTAQGASANAQGASANAQGASANAQAATPGTDTPAAATPAPATTSGTQFITAPCKSDADCAAGCCGFNSGKCAGAVVAQERDGGCGFGDATPNDNAAQALKGQRLGKRGVVYWM